MAVVIALCLSRPTLATPPQAPPAPDASISIYNAVEAWVRAWAVPKLDDPLLPKVAGVGLTLRLHGRVIANAAGFGERGESPLRAVVEAALAEGEGRIDLPNDALRGQALADAAGRVTISLELAGAPVPFEPASLAEAAALVSPGIEGVGVRIGNRFEAMFPGMMLATGTDAGAALASLVSKVSGDPTLALKPLSELAAGQGVTFYRFRTTHLAQTRPGEPPIFLLRGGRLVLRGEITTASLRRFADEMAGHLIARESDAGVVGSLLPTHPLPLPGQEREMASPAEEAVLALALLRYASTPGADAGVAESASGFALRILTRAADGRIEARLASDPIAAAALIVAAAEAGRDRMAGGEEPALGKLVETCRGALVGAFDPATGFTDAVPDGGRSLVAWGLVRLARLTGGAGDRERAARAVRAVYRETPRDRLVAQMPWLGWAELELAGEGGEVPAAVGLREMRDLLWEHQLSRDDAGPDSPDLVGGIVFTSSKSPLPSWHSARPLAFVGTMLGDGRLTEPGEVPAELARLLASLRFMRQLMADQAAGHMYLDPARATGGVRSALWDQRMPVDATSLSLLTVVETLRSLGEVKVRQETAGAPREHRR